MRDDVPLPRAGVLRLVDQHVIDAAVELVVHPAGGDAVQHGQRLVDQIVVVEQAALLLLAPVVRRRRGRDVQQRLGAVAGDHGAARARSAARAGRLRLEQPADRRIVCRRISWSRPILRGVRSASVGTRRDTLHLRGAGRQPAPRAAAPPGPDRSCCRSSRTAAIAFQRDRGRCGPSTISRSTSSMRSSGVDAERRRDLRHGSIGAAGGVGPGHEVIAAEAGLAHHVLEGDVGGARHRDRQRAAGCAVGIARRHRAAPPDWRAPSSRSGRGRRARRSAPAHWPRTETAAAAGCTARGWSAPSGRPASPARRRTVRARDCASARRAAAMPASRIAASSAASSSVDPVAERGEHPLRHVGGGRLGEGDAEDFFRRHAVEQQPDHALHQHVGLARAGIGRDERRGRRDRRRAPAWRGRLSGMGRGAFTIPRSPVPPAADHSLMRARSS